MNLLIRFYFWKAVMYRLSSWSSSWWKAELRSNLVKYFAHFSSKIKSSRVGVGEPVLSIAVLAFLISIQSLTPPSLFGTITSWLSQGVASEIISSIISCCSKCSVSFCTFFLNANGIRRSAWATRGILSLIWSFKFSYFTGEKCLSVRGN